MVTRERSIGPDLYVTDIDSANAELEKLTTAEILGWATRTFGASLAASSSFQSQSMPLLHLLSMHAPEVPVLFLDTGFHFAKTLSFRDQIVRDWGLTVLNLRVEEGHEVFRKRYGNLYERSPDECCRLNKVEPMRKALREYRAWIAGVRRDQTALRNDTPILSQREDGVYKICPMAAWRGADVTRYINIHDLPVHPLLSQGYMSIGCEPCTKPAFTTERSGRWADSRKVECGLHTSVRELNTLGC